MARTLSEEGYRLIRNFEGYHRKLPDGSCTTYVCPAGILTIGYGCTKGIKKGEVWTKEKAEQKLREEISHSENAINRMVTVDLTQGQFDALVSLDYNLGSAGYPTLLRQVNKKQFVRAANSFAMYRMGGGEVLPGLVSRRAREAALFMKPDVAPEEPHMAQKVTAVPNLPGPIQTSVAGGGATLTANALLSQSMGPPAPPDLSSMPAPPDITPLLSWKGFGDQLASLAGWAHSNNKITLLLMAWLGIFWIGPGLYVRAREKWSAYWPS